MHKGLNRNFQLMPGAQWLELLSRHIPDRFEHLVRYVGWCSTRCRGERARKAVPAAALQALDGAEVIAARAKSAWARLIHKVYEVDPLACPKCGAPMHDRLTPVIDKSSGHHQPAKERDLHPIQDEGEQHCGESDRCYDKGGQGRANSI